MKQLLAYLFLILLFGSCKNPIPKENPETIQRYLHIAHTRTNTNPTIDSTVEKVDFSKYNMLWLGGDLAKSSSIDDSSMAYLESIFNVKSETTLWSLGNHDYSSLERVKRFTKRPAYYAYQKNGLSMVVLDTQDSLSNLVGAQKELLFDILDTIKESSHLILLHHKLIWMSGNASLEPEANSISNGGLGDCFHCINLNNFYTEIYPALVKVRERGVEVVCIGGDIGFKQNEFEHETAEGIYFLASGIDSEKESNKALLFEHDLTNRSLDWSFQAIENL